MMFNNKDYVLIEGCSYDVNGVLCKINPFYICKHQVTQDEYTNIIGYNPSFFVSGLHPVETISWYESISFCNRLSIRDNLKVCYIENEFEIICDFSADGYRLPTELEWLYTAKGANFFSKNKYSGSNDINEVGWYYNDEKHVGTHNIMLKKPNELGIYDMTGNVWEWCWDWFKTKNECLNEDEYFMTRKKVSKGGSWGDYAEGCINDYRGIGDPKSKNKATGFRIVRTAKKD